MTWGQWGKKLNKKEMQSLISHCIDSGVTTFDHADIYGAYTTEAEFGKAIEEMTISRHSYQIITKCGIQYQSENRNNRVKHYDYSKDYIIWSVERSLKDLKTDYIDLLLLHRPSPLMKAEEIAEAVTVLKSNGLIKRFGVSNFTPSQMDLVGLKIDIEYNQIECSITHFNPMLDGTLDYMTVNGIVPMAWSPLGEVFRQSTEQTARIETELQLLCEKYQAEKDQILLAWLHKHPSGIHPVIGTTTKERISMAKEALSIELDLQDWFLLLVASQGHKVP